MKECVNSYYREAENDDCYEYITDSIESLLPNLVAQTDCLECAPETVAKVKAKSYEPNDVENDYPPVLECCLKKLVRILSVLAHELLKLHVCPEVVEVECDKTKNYDTKNEHVLRSPRLSFTLATTSVTVKTTASLDVTSSKNTCVNDVYDETECKYRNHDCYNRKCHEVATCLEKTVSCSVSSLECINHRKEVDSHVKEKEHDKEQAAYTHDKLLSN